MDVINIDALRPSNGGAARFEGHTYGANVSFFVVTSAPGTGADKHRHPYEEIFVILDGAIEVIVAGNMVLVYGGNSVVIPANTWHAFKNRSKSSALMVNIHPRGQMIQEDWGAEYTEQAASEHAAR